MHPITRDSINSNHLPDDREPSLTRGVPEAQDPIISNVSDMTVHHNEEPHSCASFFYVCWEKLCKSVHTFFSYATYYLTCCFSRGSFEDVTQYRAPSMEPTDEQISVAEIVRDVANKTSLIEKNIKHIDSDKDFYTEQQNILENYLGALDDALSELGTIIAPSPATKDQGKASAAANPFHSENPNINLLHTIGLKAKALKGPLQNNTLVPEHGNNLLSEMEELVSPCEETRKAWFNSGRLTTIQLVFKISEALRDLERKKSSYHSLQQDLDRLILDNDEFALDIENQLPPSSIKYVHGDIQALHALSEEQWEQLSQTNLTIKVGVQSNMQILYEAVEAFQTSIKSFKAAKIASENQALNQKINTNPFGRRRGL